jgi:exportin-2 (importin alpha re-exporter)
VIPDGEKEQVKAHITDLMLSAPPRVRAQLSEALSIISSHDFPARWQGLLPHLVAKLGSPDPQLVAGVLSTADSIYLRYRCVLKCVGGWGGWSRLRSCVRVKGACQVAVSLCTGTQA